MFMMKSWQKFEKNSELFVGDPQEILDLGNSK
jgi:hypothetical protein